MNYSEAISYDDVSYVDVNALPLKPPQPLVPPGKPVRRSWHPVMWDDGSQAEQPVNEEEIIYLFDKLFRTLSNGRPPDQYNGSLTAGMTILLGVKRRDTNREFLEFPKNGHNQAPRNIHTRSKSETLSVSSRREN